ncbi:hypothetical protein [Bradyrhizobium valentinum]|uniref:hypothetical protein n=1 Tax=Bradyrhizobium valentinum TaxID=1518501 RepID=UPI003B8479F4
MSDTRDLFATRLHPYASLTGRRSVPDADAKRDDFTLAGEIPSSIDFAPGCRLRGRSPHLSRKTLEGARARPIRHLSSWLRAGRLISGPSQQGEGMNYGCCPICICRIKTGCQHGRL